MTHIQQRAFAVLGLSPGANEESAKQAFRDLAQVWHPDRFTHDERLRAKAEEKFKEINGAYQALCPPRMSMPWADRSPAPPAPPARPAPPAPAARPAAPFPHASHAHTRAKPASARGGHSPRNVRMELPAVAVMFAGRQGRLINMSITGAQLILDVAPEVNTTGTLILEGRGEFLRLDARVVRAGSQGPERRQSAMVACSVSVKFDNISPRDQRAIPRFCNMLLAEAAAATR